MAQPVLKFEFPSFPDLQQAFKELPKGLRATTQAAAVRRAMLPCVAALKQNTARGPTGNLQRSVAIKSIRYNSTGTGVAVVGFTKAGTGKSKPAARGKVRKGKDRAFHQFWIEFGIVDRMQAQQPIARTWAQTKGQVASRMETEMRQGLVNAKKQLEIRAAKAAAKRAAASA